MRKIIVLFVCIWNSYSQTHKKDSLNIWRNIEDCRIAAGYLENLEIEASLLFSNYYEQGFGGMGMRVQNVGAGVEYLLVDNKHVFGAKLSYENTIAFFAGQIGADYLITDKSKQVRIMPKIGLSVFGLITLYYGYNLNVIKQSDLQTQKHVISLQLNLVD